MMSACDDDRITKDEGSRVGHDLLETGNERQSPFLMMHESFQIDVLREKTLFKTIFFADVVIEKDNQ